ncbi:hypothetical protein BHM03_00032376 [Ensete ventricosum]|uniref:Uncharacterized protein n=1 Tax=Ensete ventricosum TaxID=4639 RepID=A0A445MIW1_ENSVE|nr:hypothetical protein BHM03_00032376 [Ensete ventricosum]
MDSMNNPTFRFNRSNHKQRTSGTSRRWSKRLPKTWKGIKDGEESPVFPWGIGGHSGSSSSSSSSRDRVRRPPPTGSCGPRTQQKEEEEAEKVDQRGEETDLRGGGDEKGDEEAGKEEDDAQEEGSGQPYLLAYQPRQQGRPGPSVSFHRGGRGGIFLPVSSDGKGSKRRVLPFFFLSCSLPRPFPNNSFLPPLLLDTARRKEGEKEKCLLCMTIASKLFYCRRTSASSRSSEQELDRVNADRDRRLRRDRRSSPSRARQLVHPRSARTDKSLVLFLYQLVDNGDADISDHPRAEVSNMSKCNHWKTATASDQLNSGDPAAEIIFQAEQVSSSSDINKKPCVLGHRLKDELFVNTEGEGIPKGLLDRELGRGEKLSLGHKRLDSYGSGELRRFRLAACLPAVRSSIKPRVAPPPTVDTVPSVCTRGHLLSHHLRARWEPEKKCEWGTVGAGEDNHGWRAGK